MLESYKEDLVVSTFQCSPLIRYLPTANSRVSLQTGACGRQGEQSSHTKDRGLHAWEGPGGGEACPAQTVSGLFQPTSPMMCLFMPDQ